MAYLVNNLSAIKKCPGCSGKNVKYGMETIKMLLDINSPARIGFMSLIGHGVSSFITGNLRAIYTGMTSSEIATPLLICNSCKTYYVMCPHCYGTHSFNKTYPKHGKNYNCINCHKEFWVSGECEHFTKLFDKNLIV